MCDLLNMISAIYNFKVWILHSHKGTGAALQQVVLKI
jgi:hypothetical protein